MLLSHSQRAPLVATSKLLNASMVLRSGTVGLSFAGARSSSGARQLSSLLVPSTGRQTSNRPAIASARRQQLLEQYQRKASVMVPARALYFSFQQQQTSSLSTLRNTQSASVLLRTGDEAKKPVPTKDLGAEPVKVATTEEPKKTLMEKIKHEALHYWHGTKLFAKEVKLSSKLVSKVVWGGKLTRREQRQLRRTFTDTVRLVPFLLFVVIPFAELLLPVALKLFPGMLPSTYEDKAFAEKKREKVQGVRNEMARYLKETIAEMGKARSAANGEQQQQQTVEDTSEFLAKIRSSGEGVSTSALLQVAKIFEDDLTLDNLSRPQLVSICRFMGVNAFGTDNYLRYQITNRMRYIRADDKVIAAEGIDSLSVPELQSACQSRGIRTVGVSPQRMRESLEQWIDLHVERNIPSTLLILSRIITAGEPQQQQQQLSNEALQATINSLPDNLVNEATLRLAEVSGKATSKQKLEVLEEQEELIEDEDVQEKKQKSAEEAAAKAKPKAETKADIETKTESSSDKK
ncbi:LETM1-like protein-domain-containing protein [Kickxella alabastrina]|uniref:LETM1-like protein-domain-containing protein n=1 Tax=Kickxella alabastrina TaxID=61397 RepID=UPI00222081D6|nr:LETM1-like protein-domain-containing protein [Kickxella alabastrina]KAI7833905.1 LETM1-like protein-domain-containing protein [Kickxella alabastrina]